MAGIITVDDILTKYKGRPDALIDILHEIQDVQGFLSDTSIIKVAEALDLPASKVYGVATFYSLFTVKPRGRNVIRICESAPCHVLGATAIINALEKELGIKMGETTGDGKFTLEYTSCIGVCGVAPAIMINEVVYGNLTPDKIPHILSEYR
ncbi:MAG TPA: NADH-quinone oxidoreductase subunit NuoE [Firmicutes bacterium]|nr:NADH-quinone oxidoreductase subunit NuoE [Bacillota bacterium]